MQVICPGAKNLLISLVLNDLGRFWFYILKIQTISILNNQDSTFQTWAKYLPWSNQMFWATISKKAKKFKFGRTVLDILTKNYKKIAVKNCHIVICSTRYPWWPKQTKNQPSGSWETAGGQITLPHLVVAGNLPTHRFWWQQHISKFK